MGHLRAERDLLIMSQNPWIVAMYFTFQDADKLYMVMEFLPGGDLMRLLMREGTLPEPAARLYMVRIRIKHYRTYLMIYYHR